MATTDIPTLYLNSNCSKGSNALYSVDQAIKDRFAHCILALGFDKMLTGSLKKYGTKVQHFAKNAEKNHRHSAKNPYSQFSDIYTLDEILNSPKIHYPLTKFKWK